jgi:hypothetical protein
VGRREGNHTEHEMQAAWLDDDGGSRGISIGGSCASQEAVRVVAVGLVAEWQMGSAIEWGGRHWQRALLLGVGMLPE